MPPERLLIVNVFEVPVEPNEVHEEPPFVEYCQVSQVVFAVAVKLTLVAVALLNFNDTVGAVLSSLSRAIVFEVDIVPTYVPERVAFISKVAAIDIDFEPSEVCVTVAEAVPNLVVTPPLLLIAGMFDIVVFVPLIVIVADREPMYRS